MTNQTENALLTNTIDRKPFERWVMEQGWLSMLERQVEEGLTSAQVCEMYSGFLAGSDFHALVDRVIADVTRAGAKVH